MAPKHWRFKDGLRIPHFSDPSRKDWDRKYYQAVVDVFGNGDPKRLRKVKVPATEEVGGHFVQGAVGPGGRNRHPTYRKMLAGGDRLPPAVVRRNGISWTVVDGNSRLKAAIEHGSKTLDAYEIVEPEPKLKKAEKTEDDDNSFNRKQIHELRQHLDSSDYQGRQAGYSKIIEDAQFLADQDPQIKEDVQAVLLHPDLSAEDARVALGTAYRTDKGLNLGQDFYLKAVDRWKNHPEVVHRIGRIKGIDNETVHEAVKALIAAPITGPNRIDYGTRSDYVENLLHNQESAEPKTLKMVLNSYHLEPGDWSPGPMTEVARHPRFSEIEPAFIQNHLQNSYDAPNIHPNDRGLFARHVAANHPEMISPEFLEQRMDRGDEEGAAHLIHGLALAEKRKGVSAPALTADNLVAATKLPYAFSDSESAGTVALAHPNMPSDYIDSIVDPDSDAFHKHFAGAFGKGHALINHVLKHHGNHHHLKPETVRKLVADPEFGYGAHFLAGPHGTPELLDAMMSHRKPGGMHPVENAINDDSDVVQPRHLQQVLDDSSWPESTHNDAIAHHNLPRQDLHNRVKKALEFSKAPSPDENGDMVYSGDKLRAMNLAQAGIRTGRLSVAQLKELKAINHSHPSVIDQLNHQLTVHDPDSSYLDSQVAVKLGVAKHRMVRDAITATGRTEAAPNQLPPGDWSQARLKNGNISSERLQSIIDAKPPQTYNYSHDTWDGAQRHSEDSSNVFQVNMTTKHLEDMKAAGVYNTFKRMHEETMNSGHPAHPEHGLGWVRWTGDPKEGVFIDEAQSDFGQHWKKIGYSHGKSQALKRGNSEEQAHQKGLEAQAKVDAEFPPAEREKIQDILFGKAHPNEVLTEAFHQYLRDQGHHNTPVHVHSVESKAPISLGTSLPRKCKTCGKHEDHEEHGRPGHNTTIPHDFRPHADNPNECVAYVGGMSCGRYKEDHAAAVGHSFVPGEVDRTKAPAHFSVTYHDVPKKMGKTPAQYGELRTQIEGNNRHTIEPGTPTWGGIVRKSEKKKQETQIASIAAFKDGKLLVGKRNDNQKWTLPGGHIEEGESHREAAARELLEETGLEASNLEYLGTGVVSRGNKTLRIYCYQADVEGEPSGEQDPDNECSEWRFVEGLPEEIAENLHSKNNVTLRLLGLQEGEVVKTEDFLMEFQELKKTVPQKTQSEFQAMLAGHRAKKVALDSRIQELVSNTRASVWAHGNGLHTVVATDPHNRNQWRATRIGPGGEPLGHDVAADHAGALLAAHANGADLHQEPKSFFKKDEEGDIFEVLKKGLPGLALAGALAFSSGGATPTTPQQALSIAQKQTKPWTPEGLHPELLPIAHLESSFGQNTNHVPDPRGEYYSAHGALGLKACTAHEQYLRSPTLQQLYPDLKDPSDFTKKLKSDHSFYNLVGSAHYIWLKKQQGTPEKAAFAWRHGLGAATKATESEVNAEPYVLKYRALAAGVHPSKLVPDTMSTGLKHD
jgi:8-oxo-dGTP pyrophosphatase MutT (NUDIX family)